MLGLNFNLNNNITLLSLRNILVTTTFVTFNTSVTDVTVSGINLKKFKYTRHWKDNSDYNESNNHPVSLDNHTITKKIEIFDWDEAISPTDFMHEFHDSFWGAITVNLFNEIHQKKKLNRLRKINSNGEARFIRNIESAHLLSRRLIEDKTKVSDFRKRVQKDTVDNLRELYLRDPEKDRPTRDFDELYQMYIEKWETSLDTTNQIINKNSRPGEEATTVLDSSQTIIVSNGSWNTVIQPLLQTQVILKLLNFNGDTDSKESEDESNNNVETDRVFKILIAKTSEAIYNQVEEYVKEYFDDIIMELESESQDTNGGPSQNVNESDILQFKSLSKSDTVGLIDYIWNTRPVKANFIEGILKNFRYNTRKLIFSNGKEDLDDVFSQELNKIPLYRTLMEKVPIVTFREVATVWDDCKWQRFNPFYVDNYFTYGDIDSDDVVSSKSSSKARVQVPSASTYLYGKILEELIRINSTGKESNPNNIPENVILAGQNLVRILNIGPGLGNKRHTEMGLNQSDVKLFFTYIAIRETVVQDSKFSKAMQELVNGYRTPWCKSPVLYLESTGDNWGSEGKAYEELVILSTLNLELVKAPFRKIHNSNKFKDWGLIDAWQNYLKSDSFKRPEFQSKFPKRINKGDPELFESF